MPVLLRAAALCAACALCMYPKAPIKLVPRPIQCRGARSREAKAMRPGALLLEEAAAPAADPVLAILRRLTSGVALGRLARTTPIAHCDAMTTHPFAARPLPCSPPRSRACPARPTDTCRRARIVSVRQRRHRQRPRPAKVRRAPAPRAAWRAACRVFEPPTPVCVQSRRAGPPPRDDDKSEAVYDSCD